MTLFLQALAIIASSTSSKALPICYDRGVGQYGYIAELAMEIEDSGTHRQTVAEYAHSHDMDPKVAAGKFAATGIVNCKGTKGSGNLVIKNDLVLASGTPS